MSSKTKIKLKVIELLVVRDLIIAGWLVGLVLLGANTAFAAAYEARIYPGVKIGAANLGGLTREEARKVIQEQIATYKLSVTVDAKQYEIKPEDLGTRYEVETTLEAALRRGRGYYLPLLGLFDTAQAGQLGLAYSVDQVKLAEFVSKIATEHAEAPVDAKVEVVEGSPVIHPEKSGLGVNQDELMSKLRTSIAHGEGSIAVQRTLKAAEVNSQDVQPVVEAAKKLISTKIELDYAGKKFTPTPSQIGSWLDFNKQDDGSVLTQINFARVKAYIASLAAQIDVAPVAKQISVVNGVVREEKGGVEGSAVEQDKLTTELISRMTGSTDASLAIPTVKVAFKTIYNRSISIEGGRYIEINLSSQRLWAYHDHQLVYTSPVTSGATGAGFPTVQGLFSIYSKERNRYLNGRPLGYNYNVFVQYWMPFHRDFGLHDASWREVFGGSDYYYNGSHGCVNLPTETAAWLFNWATIGTPVWVHS